MAWWIWFLCWGSGYHFADVTVYDPEIHGLREGVTILVDGEGRVEAVSREPIAADGSRVVVEGGQVLPHYADFYGLIQERGLGLDKDLDPQNQRHLAACFLNAGIYQVRDPMFPPEGLRPGLFDGLDVVAQRGYIELPDGPSSAFSLVADPQKPAADFGADLPDTGPATFWWSSAGTGKAVLWPEQASYLRDLIRLFRSRGQKVGAYIQDAKPAELAQAHLFGFDFYEGMPADLTAEAVSAFPAVTWVPLAALNDKRYCGDNLLVRLKEAAALGLYDQETYQRASRQAKRVLRRLKDRCEVWQRRRHAALKPLRTWLERDGALALGSASGHLFSFSGDLRSELELLAELDATQSQLLRATFETTPALLGDAGPYLEVGRPAHFIVYERDGYWGLNLGAQVDWNFVMGETLVAGGRPVEVAPPGQ